MVNVKKLVAIACGLTTILCGGLAAQSLSTHKGPISLSWVSDKETGYTQYGEPISMTNNNAQLPNQLLNNIYTMLPESTAVNPSFVDSSLKSNIIMADDFAGQATVSITFLNEGAGYRNSFEYFLYDPSNPTTEFTDISEHIIVFPNASKPNEGRMTQGDNVANGRPGHRLFCRSK